MAIINFPTSPVDGQTYTAPNGVAYTYSSAVGAWLLNNNGGGGGGGGTYTGTAPIAVTGTVISLNQGLGVAANGSNLAFKLPVLAAPPATGTGTTQAFDGSVYWDNSLGQLFVRYNDGITTQWVAAAPPGGAAAASFPAGTLLSFPQAAAPTGWSQVATFDDASIRLVGSTGGGGQGGSIGFATLFSATATYSGSINITSGQVGDTALSTAQLASHSHTVSPAYNLQVQGPNAGGNQFYSSGGQQFYTASIDNTGSSAVHTHSLVGAAAGGNFTSDFSVKYVNYITCSKS
jgi:hypothetical protein